VCVCTALWLYAAASVEQLECLSVTRCSSRCSQRRSATSICVSLRPTPACSPSAVSSFTSMSYKLRFIIVSALDTQTPYSHCGCCNVLLASYYICATAHHSSLETNAIDLKLSHTVQNGPSSRSNIKPFEISAQHPRIGDSEPPRSKRRDRKSISLRQRVTLKTSVVWHAAGLSTVCPDACLAAVNGRYTSTQTRFLVVRNCSLLCKQPTCQMTQCYKRTYNIATVNGWSNNDILSLHNMQN